jgi:hypothetical protein
MTLRFGQRPSITLLAGVAATLLAGLSLPAEATQYPVTPQQKSTAQQVASAGVPLSELAADAPDSYTVKRGDTLWAISKLFLKSPWRWPELWGMNLEQIHNPHLIYPGQVLVLEKSDGRARLKLATAVGGSDTVKLSPSVRSESSEFGAIASIAMNVIGPFLNDALVFENQDLEAAPRVVATQEGRVLLSRGDLAYVLGDTSSARDWQLFRSPKPLLDPVTHEVLGYEARYSGSAERVRSGETRPGAEIPGVPVPTTFRVTSVRDEVTVGDRLTPAMVRDFDPFVPHSPDGTMNGSVVSLYGDALSAGTNQIVSINRGKRDGVERGHVLALWSEGALVKDQTDPKKSLVKIPDEKHGLLFVFRVFDRVSYALVVQADLPIRPGDRFSKP